MSVGIFASVKEQLLDPDTVFVTASCPLEYEQLSSEGFLPLDTFVREGVVYCAHMFRPKMVED